MKQSLLIALLFLSACASGSGDGKYQPPGWTREFCAARNWAQLGADDATRFEDGERRFAALNQTCGIHFVVPRDDYFRGRASVVGEGN